MENQVTEQVSIPGADIEYEIKYTVSSGNSTIIPLNSTWNSVIIQVSGGLDLSLIHI